jgi:hypothetical protein
MFRDEREAALARAAAAERRAEELEAKLGELEAALAGRDEELARLRPIAEKVEARAARERELKEREEEKVRQREQARREARDASPSRFRPRLRKIGMAAGLAGLVGAVILGGRACSRHRAETRPGEITDVCVVKRGDGTPALLFVTKVYQGDDPDDYRLDLVDPESGARLRRLVLPEQEHNARVAAASPGLVWVAAKDRLALRALPDLGPVERYQDLVRTVPALAGGLHGEVEVDGWSGAALVTTKTGEQLRIDSRDLRVRAIVYKDEVLAVDPHLGGGHLLLESARAGGLFDKGSAILPGPNAIQLDPGFSRELPAVQVARWRAFPRLGRLGASRSTTVGSVEVDGVRYSFEGSPRRSLHRQERGAQGSESVSGSPRLIDAELVAWPDGRALVLPGPGLLVRHKVTLGSADRTLLFSHVTLAGNQIFMRSTPGRGLAFAHLAGPRVVLAIEDEKGSYLIALDAHDGSVGWRYAL